ncbi:hypothetical protein DF185_06165 [Marinifilum breve]|uniref:SMI1/KNR4 family protein n=1 Tax=Marinifilum breve TaxID=2184082 RepID=A0A2V4A0N1_9BACT|nr:SUKH-4 family immunity protein [Marinifilum breve]PXY02228.1 hypothetical protein DF185_06165 [Marinifilum breve]
MNFEEYKDEWKIYCNQFIVYELKNILNQNIPECDKQFLAEFGLPKDASMCLNFTNTNYDNIIFKELPQLCDMYNLDLEDWDSMGNEYNSHYCIGSDGSGNPICINSSGEIRVILMDYTLSGQFEWDLVNTSTEKMAKCLIEQERFAKSVLSSTLAETFYEADIPVKLFNKYFNKLSEIDKSIFDRESIWHFEIEELKERIK